MKVFYNSAAGEARPELHDGDPPEDQSATVAQLTQALNDANAVIAQFKAYRDKVVQRAQARVQADAASVDGQADLDDAQGLP
ncbi:MAG: hypothetical protein IT518_04675 [Burkholderiales bacterium]|nr:hypothetical protein [Burkholderiales bacterium]